MSTKLRIMVKKRNHKPIVGAKAIQFLVKTVQSRLLNMIWPMDWDKQTTKQKLEFLAKYLPSDTRLLLFREPRWTRRTRSRYIQLIHQAKRLRENGEGNYIDEAEVFPDNRVVIPQRRRINVENANRIIV